MITIEDLPKAVVELTDKIDNIERLIIEYNNKPKTEADQLLTVEQCADYLNLSKPTIYGLISKGELPVMKRSKRCYFSKVELFNYLKAGRRKTNAEIQNEVDNNLSKIKRGES